MLLLLPHAQQVCTFLKLGVGALSSLKLEEDTLAADKASTTLNSARKPAAEGKRAAAVVAAAAAPADQVCP